MHGQRRLRGLAGLVLAVFLQAAPVHAQAVTGVPQTAVPTSRHSSSITCVT